MGLLEELEKASLEIEPIEVLLARLCYDQAVRGRSWGWWKRLERLAQSEVYLSRAGDYPEIMFQFRGKEERIGKYRREIAKVLNGEIEIEERRPEVKPEIKDKPEVIAKFYEVESDLRGLGIEYRVREDSIYVPCKEVRIKRLRGNRTITVAVLDGLVIAQSKFERDKSIAYSDLLIGEEKILKWLKGKYGGK